MDPKLCEEAGECGYRSILIMSGVLSGLQYQSHLYSYEGPFGVGYACASYLLSDPIVDLAKLAIRNMVLNHSETTVPLHTPQHLLETKAGVFVSIHKQGQLRGCIGTITPTQPNVALEIITCAIWACTEDPRFSPVKANELEQLEIHVDLLGSPEKINGPEALDIHRYGVIVVIGDRKGLLLPDLEGINSVSQQISIALQKAGISLDEDYQLERFEVIRHHD
jgi:AmmeMemoRadiSam system protein A